MRDVSTGFLILCNLFMLMFFVAYHTFWLLTVQHQTVVFDYNLYPALQACLFKENSIQDFGMVLNKLQVTRRFSNLFAINFLCIISVCEYSRYNWSTVTIIIKNFNFIYVYLIAEKTSQLEQERNWHTYCSSTQQYDCGTTCFSHRQRNR